MAISLVKTNRQNIMLNHEYAPNALPKECPDGYSYWWEYHTKSGRAYLYVKLPDGQIVQTGGALIEIS